ncbi:hypothetical protein [Streptomyces radicis]|uniref:DUF3558 domain-containing protein n=1 Tax=Streptomyces radicis TaxID=1750517 RepID=A0A3A9VWD7_9ACTN|nr:hypothetical protein [Streptomyces radicis]RKN05070.1 hypothetical protein D7319_26245 [Streptomyces radicis]RKN16396.1 hypothetical protein D7318_25610 [Streptomyces radicis]
MSALLLSATACTSGGGDEEVDHGGVVHDMSADEVCRGTLAGGADSLEARSGETEFGEIDTAPSYDPRDYADVLMENDVITTNLCVIYTPSTSPRSFASITFSWVERVPTPGARPDATYYDITPYGSASDQNATMGVPCPVGAAPDDAFLQGELAVQTPGSGSDHDDMIAILNSAAHAVVEALGCTEESGLTPEPPARWEAPA